MDGLRQKRDWKTAIYRYFQSDLFLSKNPTTVITPLNFKSYPWPIHKLYKESMEGEFSAYYKSWEYIIITHCLINLIDKIEKKQKVTGRLRRLKKLSIQFMGNHFLKFH